MNIINTPKTMSSREIAILVESRHDNVKRTIQRLIESNTIQPTPLEEVKNQKGQTVTEYRIGKRDSYIVVAQLSPEFTARLVDRWQELEEKEAFKVPTNFIEAMELATEQAKQLEAARPKLEVYEALADRKGDVSTTLIAKQLGMTAIKLNKFLREKGVKWEKADLPKAGYQDWFNVVADTRNGHEYTQCLVTPLGQIEIAKLINKDGK